jgi:hypothetical protein
MTILHIILDEHADGIEYGLVLGNTMLEALLKDLKAFNPATERFMASFGPSFEGLNQIRILAIAGCDLLLGPFGALYICRSLLLARKGPLTQTS